MTKRTAKPSSAASRRDKPGTPQRGPVLPPARDTRTRILQTAFRLFHERGYHATGIAEILQAANINAGSLYHFFAGKEALLEGVLEFALEILRPAVMEPAERRSADPIERVFELLQQYREGLHAWGCRMGCPIGNLALEVSDEHAAARALIHRPFQNWGGAVTGWLESAGDRLPAHLDRAQLARFILTVMEGGIMQARAAGNLDPFDASVAQLRLHFDTLQQLAALQPSPARKSAAREGRPGKPTRKTSLLK